ncbi:MAG: nucleotide-binding protein [Methanomicrobiaceae archaeon]|nr:nucleotide-binding protein [Methanomicrobiaceae archaeon]
MSYVLDASFFFTDRSLPGESAIPPSVLDELQDFSSKCRLDAFMERGLAVREPDPGFLETAREAAIEAGESSRLSSTDLDLLALALETRSTLVTDDFAVQNVAIRLAIPVLPVQQRRARAREYLFRCTGCGRYFQKEGICPFCGSRMKRKIK